MKKTKSAVATPAAELNDEWMDKAFSAVCEFANTHIGEEHLAEEIRAFAQLRGVPAIKDSRAWGPILKKAEKNEVIEHAGYAPTVSSNGSPKVLWRMVGLTKKN